MILGLGACTQVSGTGSTSSAGSASSTSEGPADQSSAPTSAAEENSASDSPSSAESSSSRESSSSEESSSSSNSDDSGSGPQLGKVGEDVKTDKMSVKVSKITDPAKAENDYDHPDKGKRYVALHVSLTNLGSKDLRAGESCLKVKLSDDSVVRSDWVKYGQRLEYSTLYKGDTTTGDVVYQVPTDQKIKVIDVDCSYGDDRAARIQAN